MKNERDQIRVLSALQPVKFTEIRKQSNAEFEALIKAYKTDIGKTISVIEDHRTFHDLMDLLDNEEIKLLSEINYHLGVINAKKDVVKRDIEEKATEIVKNEYFLF